MPKTASRSEHWWGVPVMSREEFNATLAALDLTHQAAGRIFANVGIAPRAGERAGRRWSYGTSVVPTGVAIALRLLRELKVDVYPLILTALEQEAPPHPATTVLETEKPSRPQKRKANG